MSCLSRVYYNGDRRPSLKLKLVTRDAKGKVIPIDLSDASSVTFSMTKAGKDAVALFTNNMVILEPINGVIVYPWQAGDLDVIGKYKGWITVNWTGAERETKGDLEIIVKQRPS